MRTSSTAKIYGTHKGDNHAGNMYAAVVAQAVEDAMHGVAKPHEWLQALAFCTDTSGDWRKSRETLCEAVGVDPDFIREYVIAVLEGRLEPRVVNDKRSTKGACLIEARGMYAERNAPRPAKRNVAEPPRRKRRPRGEVHAKVIDGVFVGNAVTTHVNDLKITYRNENKTRVITLLLIGTPRADILKIPKAHGLVRHICEEHGCHVEYRNGDMCIAPNKTTST